MKRQYYNGNCFKYFFKNPEFKTIVFIHGLGLNQDVWSWQVSLFKNHNVLIYDLLGHGDSTVSYTHLTLPTTPYV